MTESLPQHTDALRKIVTGLSLNREPLRRDVMKSLYDAVSLVGNNDAALRVKDYYNELLSENKQTSTILIYIMMVLKVALKVPEVKAEYRYDAPVINGYEVLNKFFDQLFSSNQKVVAFGEDLGQIGDVNQGFSGLQAKYGDDRIFDTGIRELIHHGTGYWTCLAWIKTYCRNTIHRLFIIWFATLE